MVNQKRLAGICARNVLYFGAGRESKRLGQLPPLENVWSGVVGAKKLRAQSPVTTGDLQRGWSRNQALACAHYGDQQGTHE